MGVMTLFEVAPGDEVEVFNEKIQIPTIEFEKQQKLAFEKEMLGRYISDHPLRGYEGTIRRKCDATSLGIATLDEGKIVKVGGVITEVIKKQTQRGDLMAIVSLEDLEGEIEVVVFTKTMNQVGHKLATDRPVIVTGRIDRRDEANTKVICLEIDELKSDEDSRVTSIASTGTTTKHLENLSSLLSEHAGNCDVYVHLGSKRIWLGADVRVNPDSGLLGELRVLFGADCLSP